MADVTALRGRVEAYADRVHAGAVDRVLGVLDAVVPRSDGPGRGAPGGGHLADAREVRSAGPRSTVVSYPGDVANYLDVGTGPHIIRPRTARALVFVWPNGPPELAADPGSMLFMLARVNHPGSVKHVGWWSGTVAAGPWSDAVADVAASTPF